MKESVTHVKHCYLEGRYGRYDRNSRFCRNLSGRTAPEHAFGEIPEDLMNKIQLGYTVDIDKTPQKVYNEDSISEKCVPVKSFYGYITGPGKRESMFRKYISVPNCLTSIRLIGAIVLLFLPPFQKVYFIVYTACGSSDVLDGTIARKTGKVTEFGSKLDSVADLLFFGCMFVRLFPVMLERLPMTVWILLCIILVLRLIIYVYSIAGFHQFPSLHTILNKLTGALVFLIPYFALTRLFVPVSYFTCGIAIAAAVHELYVHIHEKRA